MASRRNRRKNDDDNDDDDDDDDDDDRNGGQTRQRTRQPTRGPTRAPTRLPTRGPTRDPTRRSTRRHTPPNYSDDDDDDDDRAVTRRRRPGSRGRRRSVVSRDRYEDTRERERRERERADIYRALHEYYRSRDADRTRAGSRRRSRGRSRTPETDDEENEDGDDDEDDEDEDDDDSDATTPPPPTPDPYENFPFVDVREMEKNLRKLEHVEEQADRLNGMRVQIRETSPRVKKRCTCVPRPSNKLRHSMVYEAKQCYCGYGTSKMVQDQESRSTRLLWSPVDEQVNDKMVTNFQRLKAEKLFLPTIPGTAPPAGYSRRPPETEVPGTAPGGRKAVPEVAMKRLVAEQPPRVRLPAIDQRLPPEDFSSNMPLKNHRGKYFDMSKYRRNTRS